MHSQTREWFRRIWGVGKNLSLPLQNITLFVRMGNCNKHRFHRFQRIQRRFFQCRDWLSDLKMSFFSSVFSWIDAVRSVCPFRHGSTEDNQTSNDVNMVLYWHGTQTAPAALPSLKIDTLKYHRSITVNKMYSSLSSDTASSVHIGSETQSL